MQEQPADEATFLKVAYGICGLAQEKFGPLHIESSFFEIKFFLPVQTGDEVQRQTLHIPGYDQRERAKAFDMSPLSQKVETFFASGNTRLRVAVAPTTIENVSFNRQNPGLGATPSQVKRAKRVTAQADRIPSFLPYAIFLEVSVFELEPPLSSEQALYKLLKEKTDVAKRLYTIP